MWDRVFERKEVVNQLVEYGRQIRTLVADQERARAESGEGCSSPPRPPYSPKK